MEPVPVLFGAILGAHGQKGPAEIPGKREFTYRHVLWQARTEGVPLLFPPRHPFNPLGALACLHRGGQHGRVGRRDLRLDLARRARGGYARRCNRCSHGWAWSRRAERCARVKAALRANTEAAIAAGVFGVPTLQIGDALFWGNDAHAFALAALHDAGVLDDPEMQRVSALPDRHFASALSCGRVRVPRCTRPTTHVSTITG
jgi:hypothetical protein